MTGLGTTLRGAAGCVVKSKWFRIAVLCGIAFLGNTRPIGVLRAADVIRTTFQAIKAPVEALQRQKPATGVDNCVEQLAREIDWLEHHIDAYGTIVAKHPDVWGQSRLTQHRFEYEDMMAQQLDKFEVRINGALRRSDQAYLGMAMSLQAAVTGNPPAVTGSDNALTVVNGMISDPSDKDSEVIVRNAPFKQPEAETGFKFENAEISLEPTTELNQMSRYLQHLQELRRINEGDDTADSPGYSLNLVRIPISVLPGGYTRKGFGAEITITATPYLSPELLPTTFRNLVINDLVDLFAPPVTVLVNDTKARELAESIIKQRKVCQEAQSALSKIKQTETPLYRSREGEWKGQVHKLYELRSDLSRDLIGYFSIPVSKSRRAQMPLPVSDLVEVFGDSEISALILRVYEGLNKHPANKPQIHLMDVQAFLAEELQGAYELLSTESHRDLWMNCPLDALANLIRERRNAGIEDCRENFVRDLIDDMNESVGVQLPPPPTSAAGELQQMKAGLAWAVIVESALLNERLVQDVREASISKGCDCMGGDWMAFYGPDPPPEARAAFEEYVKCRWPIIVFALDPVTEEQNIADSFSRRRELQLAASMAFASGNMGAQALLRFNRRLEWDMATIALNRTVIGFSHNNNTFGWRFYSRFQTPPIRGTFATIGETLFGGPTTEQDMRQRQLEAGVRECTAIVIMPSFVPYVTFDTRANWFNLTHPKHTELSVHDTMKLSRSIKSMQNSRNKCMRFAGAYRDGEIHRLLRRVDQLEHELPLQTMQVQVPYENTLGGFEMFNQGITDLAPELIGWYGEPGIHPDASTTLFLVGDHFSLHATKIVAGGKEVKFDMLSRQVLRVEIPSGVAVLNDRDSEVDLVDVHLATPYGISSHLLVPMALAGSVPASEGGEITWEGHPKLSVSYVLDETKKTATVATLREYFQADPQQLTISMPRTAAMPPTIKLNMFVWHDSTAVGAFTVDNVPLDPRTGVYYLAGSALQSMVTGTTAAPGLKGTLQAYLQKAADYGSPIDTAEFKLEAVAVINATNVPVASGIAVEVARVPKK